MLSNLSASGLIAEDNKITPTTYLRSLKDNPSKIARLLAIFILPSIALGWWYYGLAMSVAAVTPLRSIAESSEENIISEPQAVTEAPVDDSAPSSSASSVTTDQVDLKINSSSSSSSHNTTVEVDGQSIPVPEDGSTHQIIQNDNGKTTIDINVDSDTSGTSKTRSSTNINLRSSSEVDVDVKSKEVQ